MLYFFLMSESTQLSNILDLCIQIDQVAVEIYTSLSASAGSDALKGFWEKMGVDGKSHLEYWKQLKTLASYDDLPQAFHDPEDVFTDLVERLTRIQELRDQWKKDKTISSAFVIAYRLETTKLHPAFRTLFQFYRPFTDGTSPEENEFNETNINAFVEALQKYGEVTPELELVGETLQHLWNQNKLLSQQAMIDPLSNLLNRRGFFMLAHQIAHLSKRNRIPIAVLLVEVNGLKAINELHGLQKGDEVLKAVAGSLQSTLRQSDLIARYGGNRFIILLPDTSKQGSTIVAEKLRKTVFSTRPMGITVTVRIGVSEDVMKDDIKQSLSELIHRAEGNYSVAKTKEKDQIGS